MSISFADLFNKLWEAVQPAVVAPVSARMPDGKRSVVAVRDGYSLKDLPERTMSRPAHSVRTLDDLVELLDQRGRSVLAVVGDDGTVAVFVDTDEGPEVEFQVSVKADPGDVLGRWTGLMLHTELLERLTRYGAEDFGERVLVQRMIAQLAQIDVKGSTGTTMSVGANGEIQSASATASRSMSVQLPEFMETVPVPLREDPEFPLMPARLRLTAQITDSKLFVRFTQVDEAAWRRIQCRNYAFELRRKLLARRAIDTVTVVCGAAALREAYSYDPLYRPRRPVAPENPPAHAEVGGAS
jgi:hypothetical protein